jgi:putative nucleotidyltransferase with HDIG domain
MFSNLKYHVGAGSFVVAEKEERTLQAFLGTCVGVAIYDAEQEVGGLFHILLPEPICSGDTPMPEKYASSGFPLFLEALYKNGAKKENLKAVMAGGALVGPLAEMDLNLDIGGRTVDIVRKQLSVEGIPVERSETGGFFSCCLNLDLQTGEIEITPSISEFHTTSQTVEIPGKEEITQAMDRLKPIPQVALKILRLVSQDDYDISEIADEVRKDQVISAKTLKLSNSAMFSIRRKIETLDHALLLIGRDQLVKLVISASVRKLFDPDTQGYSLCKGGLYHHALGTAIVAETLAQVTGKVLPGLAYTAGLLHDIGKVVLDQYVAAAYPLFYRNVSQEGQSFLEAEKSILGTDHTQTGYELAVKWGFPETLAAAIRHHHNPEKETEHRSLTHILYISNLLMEKFYGGLELEQTAVENLPDRLSELGLAIKNLPDLVDALPESLFSTSPDAMLNEAASP